MRTYRSGTLVAVGMLHGAGAGAVIGLVIAGVPGLILGATMGIGVRVVADLLVTANLSGQDKDR